MSDTHPKKRKTFVARIRGALIAGLLVSAPLAISVIIAKWLIDAIDNQIIPLFPASWEAAGLFDRIPGSGVIILLLALIVIGGLTGGLIGRSLVGFIENVIKRTPLRVFHTTIKQILHTVLNGQSNAFQKPVLVEYPRSNCWAVGFITNEKCYQKLSDSTGDDTMVSIFLPTTPNPTSGFLLFVPKKDVRPLQMSVEEAIRLVISAGILTDEIAPKPED